MKFRIEFIVMKIFMKLVKICPKSPRFTVSEYYLESNSNIFGSVNHTYTVMWSIHYTCTPLSVYLRVIFFGTPYTCVMYGIRQCNRSFSGAEISAFFTEIFFTISVVILNSTLHYQIFKFDIDIQILVWNFGSTYRKGEILKQK